MQLLLFRFYFQSTGTRNLNPARATSVAASKSKKAHIQQKQIDCVA